MKKVTIEFEVDEAAYNQAIGKVGKEVVVAMAQRLSESSQSLFMNTIYQLNHGIDPEASTEDVLLKWDVLKKIHSKEIEKLAYCFDIPD